MLVLPGQSSPSPHSWLIIPVETEQIIAWEQIEARLKITGRVPRGGRAGRMVGLAPARADRVLASEWLREVMDRRADEVVQSLSRAVAALVKDVRGLPPGTAKALGDSPGMPVQPRLLPEAPTEISRRTGGIPLASLRRVDRFLSQADRAVSATARQVREYF